MNVLIACEESQRVCAAFRAKGHYAFSCDIQEPSGGHPEWHILGDVLAIINPEYQITDLDGHYRNCIAFQTMDGIEHIIPKWDLIIAHPPCTYLSNAGACRLFHRIDGVSYLDNERYLKGVEAAKFFRAFLEADCERIAVENPIQSKIFGLPKPTQSIEPYQFGHPWRKHTCLWLKGLPKLVPTDIVEPLNNWVSGGSKNKDGTPRTNMGGKFRDPKTRSKTFPGIAEAMAEQWG